LRFVQTRFFGKSHPLLTEERAAASRDGGAMRGQKAHGTFLIKAQPLLLATGSWQLATVRKWYQNIAFCKIDVMIYLRVHPQGL